MKPKILKTQEEYTAALALVETLIDAMPGSPKEEKLELWSLLVDYEQEQFPIDLPNPAKNLLPSRRKSLKSDLKSLPSHRKSLPTRWKSLHPI